MVRLGHGVISHDGLEAQLAVIKFGSGNDTGPRRNGEMKGKRGGSLRLPRGIESNHRVVTLGGLELCSGGFNGKETVCGKECLSCDSNGGGCT
jgi:hypothetical protein